MRALLGAITLAVSATLATAAPALVRFRGDLDAARTADDLIAALHRADTDGRGHGVTLVLGPRRVRDDLLFRVAESARRMETPLTVVIAADRDHGGEHAPVAAGTLLLVMLADRGVVESAVAFERSGTGDARALAADDIAWAAVDLDVLRVTEMALTARGAEPALAELVVPRREIWITAAGYPAGPDAGGRAAVVRVDDGLRVDVPADAAARALGLVIVDEAARWLRAQRLGRVRTIEVRSGLPGAHERCVEALLRARTLHGAAVVALDLEARPGDPARTQFDYHRAAAAARARIDEAMAALREVDDITGAYPEVLRMTAPAEPGRTIVLGDTAPDDAASWQRQAAALERALQALQTKADGYARR